LGPPAALPFHPLSGASLSHQYLGLNFPVLDLQTLSPPPSSPWKVSPVRLSFGLVQEGPALSLETQGLEEPSRKKRGLLPSPSTQSWVHLFRLLGVLIPGPLCLPDHSCLPAGRPNSLKRRALSYNHHPHPVSRPLPFSPHCLQG
jgi:hypothetical protein